MPTQPDRQRIRNRSRYNYINLLMPYKGHGLAWSTGMNTGIMGEGDN